MFCFLLRSYHAIKNSFVKNSIETNKTNKKQKRKLFNHTNEDNPNNNYDYMLERESNKCVCMYHINTLE